MLRRFPFDSVAARVLPYTLVLAAGACMVGTNVNDYVMTTSGLGAEISLRAQPIPGEGEQPGPPVGVAGELLVISTDGLLVFGNVFGDAGSRRIIQLPLETIRRLHLHGKRFSGGSRLHDERVRERLALWSRYPQGLSPEQLDVLLDAQGQERLDRIP